MLNKYRFFIAGCVVALLLATIIRIPFFGSIPDGLNRDEAALGYNSWSLLQSGIDEYGKRWPVSITSFGDQKLPGYVYAALPFISIFGLSVVSVKVPSLLAGFGIIVSTGLIVLSFTDKKQRHKPWWAILSMIFIATSPWGNHFSRVAYEAHVALFFFTSGLASLAWVNQANRHAQRTLLILASFFWSAALLTYHSYHIFLPLFVLGSLIIYRKDFLKWDRIGIVCGLGIGLISLTLLFTGGVYESNQVKIGGITPFSSQSIQDEYFFARQSIPGNTLLDKIYGNKIVVPAHRFANNLIQAADISTQFIPTSPFRHPIHDPEGMTVHHTFLFPLFFIGLLVLWQRKQEMSSQLLLVWWGAALFAPALTIHPLHTIRLSPQFVVVEILCALGVWKLWSLMKNHSVWKKYVAAGFAVCVLIVAITFNQTRYWFIAPLQMTPDRHSRYEVLAAALIKYEKEYDRVITQSPNESPYIWYLFSAQPSPTELMQNIERYPATDEGFLHVKRIGKIEFITLQWADIDEQAKQKKTALILKPQEIPREIRENAAYSLQETLYDNYGEEVYQVWSR